MEIVKAIPENLDDIWLLVRQAISNMNAEGLTQWNDQYPTRDYFEKDIEHGELYLAVDKEVIIGTIALTREQEPEYDHVPWPCKDGTHIIIHRLAVLPKWQNRGIAKKLMEFAEEHARENSYTSLRVDTYIDNPKVQRLYERLGYVQCGETHFPEQDGPFLCYEKCLG